MGRGTKEFVFLILPLSLTRSRCRKDSFLTPHPQLPQRRSSRKSLLDAHRDGSDEGFLLWMSECVFA